MKIGNKSKKIIGIIMMVILLIPILITSKTMKLMTSNKSNSSTITGKMRLEKDTIKINEKNNIKVNFKTSTVEPSNEKKEIVFLIDASQNMRDETIRGSYYKAIKLLEDYVNNVDMSNTRIALVPFAVTAYNKNDEANGYFYFKNIKQMKFYTDTIDLKDAVSDLKAFSGNYYNDYNDPNYKSKNSWDECKLQQGSNIGDALRIAKNIFTSTNSNLNITKQIVLLSQCDANIYTHISGDETTYYLGDNLFNKREMDIQQWSSTETLKYMALGYIKAVGEMIKKEKIKTHIINFSTELEKADVIKEACGGLADISSYSGEVVDNNFEILNDKKLSNILKNKGNEDANSSSGIKDVKLQLDLNNLEVDIEKIPNAKMKDGKLNIDLKCSYDSSTNNLIIPDLNISIWGNKEGNYTIKGILYYTDCNGNSVKKPLNDITLNIISSYMILKKTVDKNQYNIGDDININYNIIPQNIKSKAQKKDLDIVLVIDKSGSMSSLLDDKTTRLEAVQRAANQFIDNFEDYEGNVNIGLVDFEYFATIQSELTNKSEFKNIKEKINSISPYGGINIGDGLRRAYWMLKNTSNKDAEKYIVFLTDGEPNGYSLKNKNYIYEDTKPDAIENDYDFYGGSLEYAKEMGKKVAQDKDANIKSYMIAFTNDATSNKLKEISDATNNSEKSFYKQGLTKDEIHKIYEDISNSIQKDLYVKNITIEEVLPEGIEPVLTLQDGIKIDPNRFEIDRNNPQKMIGSITDIHYTLNSETGEYNAEPINIKLKVKGIKNGEYTLGGKDSQERDTSIISYKNIWGEDESVAFNPLKISVLKDNSIIVKQGIFTQGNSSNQYIEEGNRISEDRTRTLNVVSGIKTNMAMVVECKSDNPDISLSISKGVKPNNIKFKKYRLNDNGKMEMNTMQEFTSTTYLPGETKLVSENFSFKKGEKYIIIYEIIPEAKAGTCIDIISKIDNQEENGKKTKLIISELPDLF